MPPSVGVVAEPYADQAAGLRRLFAHERLRVAAFASASAGLGKRLLVANVAACLARQGRSVLVMDEAVGEKTVASCFGATVRRDLVQVIDGECSMAEAVASAVPGVKILSVAGAVGQLSRLGEARRGRLLSALCSLDEAPEVILVNTSLDHPLGFSPFGLAAHDTVLVMAPTPASITDAYALIKRVGLGYARRRYRLVINGVRGADEGYAVFGNIARVTHARRLATLELAACVPLDDRLPRAALLYQPVQALYPDSPAAKACDALAAALMEWPLPEAASGGMEQFVRHLLDLSHHIDPVAVYA